MPGGVLHPPHPTVATALYTSCNIIANLKLFMVKIVIAKDKNRDGCMLLKLKRGRCAKDWECKSFKFFI